MTKYLIPNAGVYSVTKIEYILTFAANHGIALSSVSIRVVTSRTFNDLWLEKRKNYILKRQRDRKFVCDVEVHRQSIFFVSSGNNIVAAPVILFSRFALNAG